ncbi:hypothetical protein HPB50_028078 [Hyalomma asiaticum]|nr:hypothetical protein HPB50_028078 [Hyalomma asiaticum]
MCGSELVKRHLVQKSQEGGAAAGQKKTARRCSTTPTAAAAAVATSVRSSRHPVAGTFARTAAACGTAPVVRRLPDMAPLPIRGVMLSRQKELPKLPVPPLQETLDRLWLSLQPILSEQELRASRQAIDKFGERGGEGEYLHRMLMYRYKRVENWLDEWWLNTAYLDVRTPLPVHSSPAALFPRQTFSSEEDFLL